MNDVDEIAPGLMVLHGNRLEELRDVLVAWLRRAPLAPLEDEWVLVQSNGIAQWFPDGAGKGGRRGRAGHFGGGERAAPRAVPLEGLSRGARARGGAAGIPFDKSRLVWRLMRLLPSLSQEPDFESLAAYLGHEDDPRKCHQLAERLADLYDQYQVYRADWLEDWAAGRDVLRDARGGAPAMAAGDRWQAVLWRRLLDDVGPHGGRGHRAAVHERFLRAIASAEFAARRTGQADRGVRHVVAATAEHWKRCPPSPAGRRCCWW